MSTEYLYILSHSSIVWSAMLCKKNWTPLANFNVEAQATIILTLALFVAFACYRMRKRRGNVFVMSKMANNFRLDIKY